MAYNRNNSSNNNNNLFSAYFAPGTVIFSLLSYFIFKKVGVVVHFRCDVTL